MQSNTTYHLTLSNRFSSGRGSYLLACTGGIGAALAVYAGSGYGEEAARHKLQRIVGDSSLLTVTVSTTDFGLDITNNTVGIVNLKLIKI